MEDLSHQAISAALSGNWKRALELNLKLLNKEDRNADILNRIARAYSELGQIDKAKKYAEKALKLDPLNSIAKKCLEKWTTLKNFKKSAHTPLSARFFLEEPGKTKIVSLVKLSNAATLLSLDCGCEVKLKLHLRSISVLTPEGKYIGRFPDDLANRLQKLIKEGNIYQAFIKGSSSTEAKIFVRELKRAAKIFNIPSFPTDKFHYVAFAAPELVHNRKTITSKR